MYIQWSLSNGDTLGIGGSVLRFHTGFFLVCVCAGGGGGGGRGEGEIPGPPLYETLVLVSGVS